jgi:hypothetical protein
MIVGVVGFIGSGKNTVGEMLVNEYGFVPKSFAAALKDTVSSIFGWQRELLEGDTEESRKFRDTVDAWWAEKLGVPLLTPRYVLQYIGTDVFRNHFHHDIWVFSLLRRIEIESGGKNVIITDVRFTNEINMVRREEGRIVRVKRGDDPEWFEMARKANSGDGASKVVMQEMYPHIHASEWGWIGCEIDHHIENDSTIDDLRKKVFNIV